MRFFSLCCLDDSFISGTLPRLCSISKQEQKMLGKGENREIVLIEVKISDPCSGSVTPALVLLGLIIHMQVYIRDFMVL